MKFIRKLGKIKNLALYASASFVVVVVLFFLMKTLITKDFGEAETRKEKTNTYSNS